MIQGDVGSDIGASATLIVSRRKGVMRGVGVGNAGGMAPMRVTVCVWGVLEVEGEVQSGGGAAL